jgi:hypothetical protein
MEELERGVVFRLARVTDDFPSDAPQLKSVHLELSSRDRLHAEKTGRPPLLSVFDVERCTIAQARTIWGGDAESSAFGFEVNEIRTLGVEGLPPLKVVRDPLDPPESELPGAEGHCGIAGLERRPGSPKMLYRELRTRLADLSFRMSGGA